MKRLAVLLAVALFAVGCEDGNGTPPGGVAATNVGFGNYLQVVEHDGHKFVIASTKRAEGGISVIHHPSCDCLKVR